MKDYDTLMFTRTTDGTIRAWLHFEEANVGRIVDNPDFKLLQALSAWGGYDKREKGLFAWELSLSLIPFIVEKFGRRNNCVLTLDEIPCDTKNRGELLRPTYETYSLSKDCRD